LPWLASLIQKFPNPLYVTTPRKRVLVSAPKLRSFVTSPKRIGMPQGRDFPALDTIEACNDVFDFAPELPAGVTIQSIISVGGAVYLGSDSAVATRLVGAASIVASPSTGAANSAVLQQIGNSPVAGVTYTWTVLVLTTDNQKIDIWARQPCKAAGP